MRNLIKKFRSIPEEKKIIVYGKLAFFKNLFYFLFKILVGVYFNSWFLIAIAIYSLFIGYVKNNCSSGLRKNKENKRRNKTVKKEAEKKRQDGNKECLTKK